MIEQKSKSRWRMGQELKAIREEQGWSTEQVALMADVKESTVEKVEQGAFNVPLDVLVKLANVLGYELTFNPKET